MATIILTAVCAVLLIVLSVLLVFLIRFYKRSDKLADMIERYLEYGESIPFCVRDDRFARLHNNVCDLETAVETEKSRHAADNRLNCDFVADVSHQLKTPLAGMKLYCEMLDSEYPCEYSGNILTLIEKTEKLVAELLKLQKLRADTFDFNFEDVDLNSVIQELKCDLLPVFPGKNINVTGNAIFRCDRMWFSQAIGNIVKNACEHTDENGIIDIDIGDSSSSVFITVHDNGGGVPENEMHGLFERFRKTSGSLAQSTGLGLAITKGIIEKHHGTVGAENDPTGLRVTVCMPRIDGIVHMGTE